jgi:hypothetical protein
VKSQKKVDLTIDSGDPKPSQDTISPISQPPQPSQEKPPVPPFPDQEHHPSQSQHRNSILSDLLNPIETIPPNLIQAETHQVESFHAEITDQTSGLTVEQLEQVNSVLMETLWKTRDQWDRKLVLKEMVEAFNAVMEDMRTSGQEFSAGSWERVRLETQ